MINIRFFQVAGKCHDFDLKKSQDQIVTLTDQYKSTIVLCDGAGSSLYGRIAAQIVSEVIGQALHKNFDENMYEPIKDIKRKLIFEIESKLQEKADELNINPYSLTTTIMAATMDQEGRYIGVHLGDGNMLWNCKNYEKIKRLSSPQRGYIPGTTYLTMNCPLMRYLRVYRYTKPETRRVILMTDGMDSLQEEYYSEMFLKENESALQQKMREAESFDDMSYIICELEDAFHGN